MEDGQLLPHLLRKRKQLSDLGSHTRRVLAPGSKHQSGSARQVLLRPNYTGCMRGLLYGDGLLSSNLLQAPTRNSVMLEGSLWVCGGGADTGCWCTQPKVLCWGFAFF